MKQKRLETKYVRDVEVSCSLDVFRELRDIKDWTKEVFLVFCLNTTQRIISREIVSIGILDRTLVHPREIFRMAILRNAASIIIAHNHPSGRVEPSEADRVVTKTIKEAGDILGIKLLDHVIVGEDAYYSFTDKGVGTDE